MEILGAVVVVGLLVFCLYAACKNGNPFLEVKDTEENKMLMEKNTEGGHSENAPGSIADDVRTIKYCVVYFTVVNIIGFISAIFLIGNMLSK